MIVNQLLSYDDVDGTSYDDEDDDSSNVVAIDDDHDDDEDEGNTRIVE